ncbi:ferritin-like metal-binding protein YciE [Algoriphagus sp. 4150]|uniref:YciE/YciF ferroxidase family protein n=1 Tax=Algoriphagus sp. 4150 TaxID=2817756 RepID=UPI00285952B2|nr:DUF892 family protein [Algoriphagus sp. 4150]MDR7127868.1 ferritin-like metal-binding protein YciE [Algoriphagus sp. 4150]
MKNTETQHLDGKQMIAGLQPEEQLIQQLRGIYWAENKLFGTIPKFQDSIHSQELAATFDRQRKSTFRHITRLEKAFGYLNQKATGKKCDEIQNWLDQAEDLLNKQKLDPEHKQDRLLHLMQQIDQYEMKTYGDLISLADALGRIHCKAIFEDNMNETVQTPP